MKKKGYYSSGEFAKMAGSLTVEY